MSQIYTCEMCDHPIEPGKEIEWTVRSHVCPDCAPAEVLTQEAERELASMRMEFSRQFLMALGHKALEV